jgi:hypothetical protein
MALEDVGQIDAPWDDSVQREAGNAAGDVLQPVHQQAQRLDGDDGGEADGLARPDGAGAELHHAHLVAVVHQQHGAVAVPEVVVVGVVHLHVGRHRDAHQRRQRGQVQVQRHVLQLHIHQSHLRVTELENRLAESNGNHPQRKEHHQTNTTADSPLALLVHWRPHHLPLQHRLLSQAHLVKSLPVTHHHYRHTLSLPRKPNLTKPSQAQLPVITSIALQASPPPHPIFDQDHSSGAC